MIRRMILHSITDIMAAAADVMDMDKAECSINRILPLRNLRHRDSSKLRLRINFGTRFSNSLVAAHFPFHRATARFPFGQTTGNNPSFRLSARTLLETRPNARSARATNVGGFFAPFVFRLLFIAQLNTGLNLH
jgi:hypothetical protein